MGKQLAGAGGRNEQCSELDIELSRRGSHSARPRNRVRGGCRGGGADRFGGEGGGTAVWPVVAGAMGWVLLRKYGWQPRTTAVMPLGTAIALFSTVAHVLMIVMLLLLPGDARPRHREP